MVRKKKLIKGWAHSTPLTTEALKYRKWTATTIDRRTEILADLAVTTWRV